MTRNSATMRALSGGESKRPVMQFGTSAGGAGGPTTATAAPAAAGDSTESKAGTTTTASSAWYQDAVACNLYDPKCWEGDVVKLGWKCPICLDVCRNVVEHDKCGSLFCEECIRRHLAGGNRQCPLCKADDLADERMIRSAKMRRMMAEHPLTCPTCGTFKSDLERMTKHVRECPQTTFKCLRCQATFPRHDLDKHRKVDCRQREETCAHCGCDVIHTDMAQHVAQVCIYM